MSEIRQILFPTDFSDHSNKAFSYAASLAEAFGAKIVLMHVAELEEEDPANPAHTFPVLDAYGGALETERVIVRGHAPYKDILDLARAKNCDLIVMATHGRSALAQFFLGGSVAEEVARFSSIPVFIVKVETGAPAEKYAGRVKEILVTTDFSDRAAAAYPYALQFAQRFNAALYTLHVIDKVGDEFYRGQGLSRDDADFKAQLTRLLEQSFAPPPGSGVVTSIQLAEGRAEQEIVKFAEARGIDLIVMGSHGHSGLGEAVIGTTTGRVIRHAPCPVLAVRG